MSRRRSSDPSEVVSLAIPRSLNNKLSDHLAYTQSRSKWICDAIRGKLQAIDDESHVIEALSSKRLVVLLFNRGIIDYTMMQLLIEKCPNAE